MSDSTGDAGSTHVELEGGAVRAQLSLLCFAGIRRELLGEGFAFRPHCRVRALSLGFLLPTCGSGAMEEGINITVGALPAPSPVCSAAPCSGAASDSAVLWLLSDDSELPGRILLCSGHHERCVSFALPVLCARPERSGSLHCQQRLISFPSFCSRNQRQLPHHPEVGVDGMRNSHSPLIACESPSLPAPGHESRDPEAPIDLLKAPELLVLGPFLALTAADRLWVMCCWCLQVVLSRSGGQSSPLGPQSCVRVFRGSVLPGGSSSCDIWTGERMCRKTSPVLPAPWS